MYPSFFGNPRGVLTGPSFKARRPSRPSRPPGTISPASSLPWPTPRTRAESNRTYTSAAVLLLKAADTALLENVLDGSVSMLEAAASVKNAVRMIEAFDAGSTAERRLFGQVVGPAKVFDDVVLAAL